MPAHGVLLAALHRWIEIFMRYSMRNFLRYSRQSGYSMSQLGTLFHIHRMGRIGVTELAADLDVTGAAASQILERLVQQGLILRSEDPHDRRVKQVMLTEKGHQILRDSIRARQEWLNDLESSLAPAEKQQVIVALNILIDRASKLESSLEETAGKLN